MISPLAYVDPAAKLGNNVTVHPFAYIDKNVEIGDDCVIMPNASILSGARIGKNTKIYQNAIISAEPQDFRWNGEDTFCYIGDNCKIREAVIINRGIKGENGTYIGDESFIMAETHIGHDSRIEGKCVIGNSVKIAGDCVVGKCSILSSVAILHNNANIGEWALVKGGCRISGNVPPYTIMAHNPITYFGVNAYVLRHKGFAEDIIDDIAKAYRHIYQCGTSVFNALKRIEMDIKPSPERQNILDFIRSHNLDIVAIANHSNDFD